jgi:hypothetical protein
MLYLLGLCLGLSALASGQTNLGTLDRFVHTPHFGSSTEAATPGRQIQRSARISL